MSLARGSLLRRWSTQRSNGLWRWVLAAVVPAAVLTSVPYIYGQLRADAEHFFSGVVAWHGDVFFYLAQMRLFRTAIVIPDPVTPETHAPVFFNGLLGPLGWIAQATGLTTEFLYLHILRVGALVAVAVAVLALASAAGLSRRARIIALLLAMYAAGWRWLVWVAPAGSLLSDLPYWRKIHVGSTLQQAMTVPHLALAAALVCTVLYWFLKGCQTGSRRSFVAAGLSLAYLTSFHPFEFAPLWATLGLLALTLALRRPASAALNMAATRPQVLEGLAWLVALPLPVLVFYAITTRASPIFQSVSQQMSGGPHESLFFLVYYGPLLPIALLTPLVPAGAAGASRMARATLLGWILVVLVLSAIPLVPMPSHFEIGLHLVGAILVAWILVDGWPAIRTRRWLSLLAPAALLLLSAPALPYYLEQIIGDLQLQAATFYLARDERAALAWIERATAPTDVVLADSIGFHMYVAPFSGARPVRGHNAMTAQVRDKDSLVRQFFSPEASADDRRAIVAQLGVRLITVSQAPPEVRAAIEALWPVRFRQGTVSIHAVGA